jgi:hypothetical protein
MVKSRLKNLNNNKKRHKIGWSQRYSQIKAGSTTQTSHIISFV